MPHSRLSCLQDHWPYSLTLLSPDGPVSPKCLLRSTQKRLGGSRAPSSGEGGRGWLRIQAPLKVTGSPPPLPPPPQWAPRRYLTFSGIESDMPSTGLGGHLPVPRAVGPPGSLEDPWRRLPVGTPRLPGGACVSAPLFTGSVACGGTSHL